MNGSARPTVFISSTVREFRDLRGALKFWLEESGFEVWISESNDMDKRPEAGTLQACFDAARRANFYILLVGERYGWLCSEPDRISVTRQEYRVARNAFIDQQGPTPIMFVRSRVKDSLDSLMF